MYVLVRKDLDVTYRCVQGAHALAKYAIEYDQNFYEWDNETIVFLCVRNEFELSKYILKAWDHAIPVSVFKEPDMGNQDTALACYCSGDIFKRLPLAD